MSVLKEWRLNMEKCLIEIERVEAKKDGWELVNSGVVNNIINLCRDMQCDLKGKGK